VHVNAEGHGGQGVLVEFNILDSIVVYKKAVSHKLRMEVKRLFTDDGTEIDNVMMLEDDCVVYASTGADFVPPAALEEVGGATRVGNYRLVRYLGRGSYGKVYEGIHTMTGKSAALKFISKGTMAKLADAERIAVEIHCLEAIDHAHVIQLWEVINTDDNVVLVFEFAGGGDLKRLVSERGKLGEGHAARLMLQIAEGVDYCHRHKIIHHDLKLENILLVDDETVKLADFGLSKVYRPGGTTTSTAGSLCYLPPEVLTEKETAGPPRDAWSMGVILYACVTGKLPFRGTTHKAIVASILEGTVTFDGAVREEEGDDVADVPFLACQQLITALLQPDPR
jgi:carbon catabolite-derepressing protein kinase